MSAGVEGSGVKLAEWFYCTGSVCFLVGTLINAGVLRW